MNAREAHQQQDRYFEVTEVAEDSAWYEPPGTKDCVLGAIVQPEKNLGEFKIIRAPKIRPLPISHVYFGYHGLHLRPLNNKDQAKLERKRRQFCAN